MPFVSEAQRRWGNSPAGIKALGGNKKVAEWNAATKGRKLPARINKKMKQHVPGSMFEKARKAKSKAKKLSEKKKVAIKGLV